MNRSLARGVIVIGFFLLIFVGNLLLDDKKDINYTDIKTEYQCKNCSIFPYHYYVDEDKKLVQVEFDEVNYGGMESGITMKVYDQDKNELNTKLITNQPKTNPYNTVTERKYIIQFNIENSPFYTFYLLQNKSKLYHFRIDIDDFERHTLYQKDENYFTEMEKLKQENSIEEYNKKKDTDFIEHNLLMEDEDY